MDGLAGLEEGFAIRGRGGRGLGAGRRDGEQVLVLQAVVEVHLALQAQAVGLDLRGSRDLVGHRAHALQRPHIGRGQEQGADQADGADEQDLGADS